jgi:hypothetical protein
MENVTIWLLKVVILSAIDLVFSFCITVNVFDLIKAFKIGTENQKKRSILCLIFFVIFFLTMHVYCARSLLFR